MISKTFYVLWLILVNVSFGCLCKAASNNYIDIIKIITNTDTTIINKKFNKDDTILIKNEVLNNYRKKGYLLVNIDSIKLSTDTSFLYLQKNKQFTSFTFNVDSTDNSITNLVKGFNKSKQNGSGLEKFIEKITSYYSNNGYPFYQLSFNNINIYNDSITAKIILNPNFQIHFDSLVFSGSVKSTNSYLQQLLEIKKGALFSQKKIDNLQSILSKNTLYDLKSKPFVVFKFDKAYVNLDIVERKSTYVNGIIGLIQQPTTKKNTVVGEFNFKTRNLFGNGIKAELLWRKYQLLSQQAQALIDIPYLLKSNNGFQFIINVIKQDTSFVNVQRTFQLFNSISTNAKISINYQINSSSVNSKYSSESIQIKSNTSKLYGISYAFNTLSSNNFMPQNGFSLLLDAKIGNKSIQNNDSLPKSSTQVTGTVKVEKNIKLSKISELRLRSTNALIFNNKNTILLNEMYRIGGINNLRGFNEQQFYTSKYSIESIDVKLFIAPESGLNSFFDIGLLPNYTDRFSIQSYKGIGLGLFLKTAAGLLQLQYAIGFSNEQTAGLSNSKVHISISSDW